MPWHFYVLTEPQTWYKKKKKEKVMSQSRENSVYDGRTEG